MTLRDFQLAKWASDSEDVMKEIPDYQRSTVTKIEFKDDKTFQKSLSVSCNPRSHTLNFKFDGHELKSGTKRELVSLMAKVYYPLGLLSSLTVQSKVLVEELWKDQYGWDEVLPVSVQTKWRKWLQEVEVLEQVEVPRCYFSSLPDPTKKEIHAFCDASQNAYAEVVYIRTVTP